MVSDVVNCFLHGQCLKDITYGFCNDNPIYNQFASAKHTLLMKSIQGAFTTIDESLNNVPIKFTLSTVVYNSNTKYNPFTWDATVTTQ